MRRLLLILFLLVTLVPAAVSAHTGGVAAVIALEPEHPEPGQPAKLKVELFDPYMVKIEAGKVKASVGADGAEAPPLLRLTEEAPGVYTAMITVPPAGVAIIAVEGELVDGLWRGALPVKVGPDGGALTELTAELLPVETGAGHGEGMPPMTPVQAEEQRSRLPWLAAGGLVLLVAAWLWSRRK